MKWLVIFFIFSVTSLKATQTPEKAVKRLQQGNHRFVAEKLIHPDRTHKRRQSLAETQSPYGVIVTCSDSRVVPEVIFDEGLGDLFVIRVAGNIIGSTELESVIYAVDHLNPSVIVVMGHENCGAVDAVFQNHDQDIPVIANFIKPSVKKAKSMGGSDQLRSSVEMNALSMRKILLSSEPIGKKVHTQTLDVYAAYYNLQTGVVDFLTP